MKTIRHFRAFGIYIPAGTPASHISTDSCANMIRFDESKGMTFTPGKVPYTRPAPGHPIAVSLDYFES